MVRASSVLASASLAAMASAAPAETTSTVTLMLPMLADNTIWASVVTAKPDATQYFIACPSGQDSNDCGLGAGFTVMNGPSTMSISMPMDTLTAAFSCKLDSTAAACTGQMTDNGAKTTSTFDSTITGSLYSTLFVPVTITAGLEKLAAATDLTGSGVSAPAATGTGASAGTSSSTAGVPRITGNVVVMGAAALAGGAAMLL